MKMLRAHVRGDVVKKVWRRDNLRCVLIVRDGERFTFLEDAASDGVTYDAWPTLAEGGWYSSAALAERDARKMISWMEKDSK